MYNAKKTLHFFLINTHIETGYIIITAEDVFEPAIGYNLLVATEFRLSLINKHVSGRPSY